MLQIPSYAQTAIETLEQVGYTAYIVGGCVRDALLGKEPNDFDITTSAQPNEVAEIFAKYHVIDTGLKHGTLTVVIEKVPVEITTYRIDGEYTDNRHPASVRFTDKIEDDLARRDFTVNAMAYSDKRGLVDCFGGMCDLENGIIRSSVMRMRVLARMRSEFCVHCALPPRSALKLRAKQSKA